MPKPEIKLSTVLSKPADDLYDYLHLLYGREKIGKTSLLAQFPDTYFLMCEPGGKALSIYKDDINDWETFKEIRRQLSKTKRYRHLVVDTADLAFKYSSDYVCKKLQIKHPSDEEWGKAWSMIRDEFHLEMSRLCKLGRGVTFVSHSQEREVRKRGGTTIHRTTPTLANQARAVLEPMVDIWSHYEYDEDGNRVLRIIGDGAIAAGHRLVGHFKGVHTIPMGVSPAEAYKNFMLAFNNNQPTKKKEVPEVSAKLSTKKVVVRKSTK